MPCTRSKAAASAAKSMLAPGRQTQAPVKKAAAKPKKATPKKVPSPAKPKPVTPSQPVPEEPCSKGKTVFERALDLESELSAWMKSQDSRITKSVMHEMTALFKKQQQLLLQVVNDNTRLVASLQMCKEMARQPAPSSYAQAVQVPKKTPAKTSVPQAKIVAKGTTSAPPQEYAFGISLKGAGPKLRQGELKNKILSIIKPRERKLRLDKIRVDEARQSAVVRTVDKGTVDTLLKNEAIAAKAKIVEIPKERPCVIVYNVPSDIPKEKLSEVTWEQNASSESLEEWKGKFTPKFSMGPKDGLCRHWVVRVEPSLQRKLIVGGSMYLDSLRLRVKPYVTITQCYRCLEYGHLARGCKKRVCCAHCGNQGHTLPECSASARPAKCSNCTKAGRANIQHSAKSKQCPVRCSVMSVIEARTLQNE